MSNAPKVIRTLQSDADYISGKWYAVEPAVGEHDWNAYIRADIAQRLAEALREVVPPPGELVSSMEQKWRKQRARERLAEYDALMGEENG